MPLTLPTTRFPPFGDRHQSVAKPRRNAFGVV